MTRLNAKYILILLQLFASFNRLYRLSYPNAYVFDEVYHAFTAKQYILGNPAAWEWWTVPPPGVAYEWTHPPVAKEIMAVSMKILQSENSWAYRLPGALLGILSILLVYLIAKEIFKNEPISLLSAFLFSIDGLNFVQSRTGMNDIYIVTFSLVSLLFFLKKRWLLSSIFLGLAIASKWSGIYLLGMYGILLLKDNVRISKDFFLKIFKPLQLFLLFSAVSAVLYLISYIPFFQLGHTFGQFIELQKQMWWYHTNIKAHHDYSSSWWSWPLDLYPVWYYVEYFPKATANIFTTGNPILFWLGSFSVTAALIEYIRKRTRELFVPLLGFLIFWLPWAFSPRIMFLYHFSPSVPFMSMLLSYETYQISLRKGRLVIMLVATLALLGFIFVYPWMTGVPLPKDLVQLFFVFNRAKDPFR